MSNQNTVHQTKFPRTKESIQAVLSADLDTMRITVSVIYAEFHIPYRDAWIGDASKRQLLAEAFFILTNNFA